MCTSHTYIYVLCTQGIYSFTFINEDLRAGPFMKEDEKDIDKYEGGIRNQLIMYCT